MNIYTKKAFYIILFCLFTAFSYKTFQSHIFSLHFVDEDENLIAGYYMSKGEKLYKDIFSHKQPLPAIISMYYQKIQKPNSLYLLVKRHRELVYFYSIIWSLVLILFFGLPAFLFSIFFEIIKPLLLGNLFLYESLVVFPLVYTLGYLWKIFAPLRHPDEGQNPPLIKTLLFSFSLALIPFLQFTLIPYFFVVLILLLVSKKINFKSFFTFYFLPFILIAIFCSFYVDYQSYFGNTLNAIRSIYLGKGTTSNPLEILFYSFLRPFASILSMPNSDFGKFTGILSLGYLISFLYLFFIQKKYKKTLILTYLLLGLTSLRIVYPDKTLYSGFHQLPWLGAFLFITLIQIYLVIQNIMSLRVKRSNLINFPLYFVVLIFAFCTLHYGMFLIRDYYRKSDLEHDWYVNYSRFYDYGQTIRILSQKGDELMVLPVEQLIYWQSGLPHATRFLYGYVLGIEKYQKELFAYWEKKPPAFVYDETNLSLFKKWWPDYIRIKNDNNPTPLFIHKEKIKTLKDWQIKEIERMQFAISN